MGDRSEVEEQQEEETSVLAVLGKRYDDADKAVAKAEEELKALKAAREGAEKALVEEMITSKLKSFKTTTMGTFIRQVETYPNVVDREALNKYVEENKERLGFLYTVQVNGQKLKSYTKELINNNDPLPPGIDPFTKIVIRRRNKGE